MFTLPFPSLYLKLAGAAVVAIAIGLHVVSDRHTLNELHNTQIELAQTQAKLKDMEDKLLQATRDRDQVKEKLDEAAKMNEKVRADLDVSLKKLRSQKPPVDCTKLGHWLVDNKDDLKWEK